MNRRNPIPTCVREVPAHVQAAWSPEKRRYYELVYDESRLGPEWTTAHRMIEMQMADKSLRDFFAEYWPHEARNGLQNFKDNHFDNEPDPIMDDSIAMRISKYYPRLFVMCLDPRMVPLFEATDTHPFLHEYHARYEALRDQYYEGLANAATAAQNYQSSAFSKKRQHNNYRAVFLSIYDPLLDLLNDVCAACDR